MNNLKKINSFKKNCYKENSSGSKPSIQKVSKFNEFDSLRLDGVSLKTYKKDNPYDVD